MTRTVLCEQLSADELALVNKAAKASPRPERHALRELLVLGAQTALAAAEKKAPKKKAPKKKAPKKLVTLDVKPETLED